MLYSDQEANIAPYTIKTKKRQIEDLIEFIQFKSLLEDPRLQLLEPVTSSKTQSR